MQIMGRTGLLLCAATVLCLAVESALAQAAPNLNPAAPIALKQGQTIEVALGGQGLGAIALAAVANPRGVNVSLVKPEKPDASQVRLKISSSLDAALGERERLGARLGPRRRGGQTGGER